MVGERVLTVLAKSRDGKRPKPQAPKSGLIIAFDFDGTLIEDGHFPDIGPPTRWLELAKEAYERGHHLILWTVRSGKELREAVEFCREHGVEFAAVNDNVPWLDFQTSRKVYYDILIDDRAVGMGDAAFAKVQRAILADTEGLQKALRQASVFGPDGDIKQPGVRGGRFYRTESGKVRYGKKPIGEPMKLEAKPTVGQWVKFTRPDADGKMLTGRVSAVGKDGVTVRDAATGNRVTVRWHDITDVKDMAEAETHQQLASTLANQGVSVPLEDVYEDPDKTVRVSEAQAQILRQIQAQGASLNADKLIKEGTAEEAQYFIDKYAQDMEEFDLLGTSEDESGQTVGDVSNSNAPKPDKVEWVDPPRQRPDGKLVNRKRRQKVARFYLPNSGIHLHLFLSAKPLDLQEFMDFEAKQFKIWNKPNKEDINAPEVQEAIKIKAQSGYETAQQDSERQTGRYSYEPYLQQKIPKEELLNTLFHALEPDGRRIATRAFSFNMKTRDMVLMRNNEHEHGLENAGFYNYSDEHADDWLRGHVQVNEVTGRKTLVFNLSAAANVATGWYEGGDEELGWRNITEVARTLKQAGVKDFDVVVLPDYSVTMMAHKHKQLEDLMSMAAPLEDFVKSEMSGREIERLLKARFEACWPIGGDAE